MRRATLLLLLSFPIPVLSQTAAGPKSSAPVTTIRSNAKLVVVDVVVTDKNQSAVHGLKVDDFNVSENGTQQQIKMYDEHTPVSAGKTAPPLVLPPGVFTNFSALPSDGPVNVLLFDRLNTPLEDQVRLQKQMYEYLRNAKPGARTAVFGLSSRLLLLQGFTDNPEILKAAVAKLATAKTSPLAASGTGIASLPYDISDKYAQIAAENRDVGAQLAGAIDTMKMFETQFASEQQQQRVLRTLDALNSMARYLSSFTGRKNLIWFSGGFPVNILPSQETANAAPFNNWFIGTASAEKEFLETISMLSVGQVAVYPIDARGIVSSTVLDATTTDPTSRTIREGPKAFVDDSNAFAQKTYDEHATMLDMANQTGGHAFINNNDLVKAVETAVENGSSYYTLAYTPTDGNWNGKFRRIQVKLQQNGFNLSYRRGYFAHNPDDLLAQSAPSKPINPSSPNEGSPAMRLALLRGTPGPTQVIFVSRVLPATTATEDALAPNNQATKIKGPYHRYVVDLNIRPQTIAFAPSSDGVHSAAFEVVTFLYDSNNALVNSMSSKVNAQLKSDVYAQVMQSGIPMRQQISVPATGEYYLRTAVHDFSNNRVGAIELPIAAVKNLPLAPSLTPPTTR